MPWAGRSPPSTLMPVSIDHSSVHSALHACGRSCTEVLMHEGAHSVEAVNTAYEELVERDVQCNSDRCWQSIAGLTAVPTSSTALQTWAGACCVSKLASQVCIAGRHQCRQQV